MLVIKEEDARRTICSELLSLMTVEWCMMCWRDGENERESETEIQADTFRLNVFVFRFDLDVLSIFGNENNKYFCSISARFYQFIFADFYV